MEMTVYFNVIIFAVITWYTFDAGKNQSAIAHISVVITFTLLLAVITFHVFHYTGLFKIPMAKLYSHTRKKHHTRQTNLRVYVLNNEHNQPLITYSVIEISKLSSEEQTTAKSKERESMLSTSSDVVHMDVEARYTQIDDVQHRATQN